MVSRCGGDIGLDPQAFVAVTLTHTSSGGPTGALMVVPAKVAAGENAPPPPGWTNSV